MPASSGQKAPKKSQPAPPSLLQTNSVGQIRQMCGLTAVVIRVIVYICLAPCVCHFFVLF